MSTRNPVRRRYGFRPSRAAILATGVALPILLALGCWQIERGREKARLLDAADREQAAAPVTLTAADPVEAIGPYRRVEVHGRFVADRQGLLDNQVRDGHAGFDVLTPLRIDGRAAVLLVDRGWLAGGARRTEVPHWLTPQAPVTLVGYLHPPTDLPLVTGQVAESLSGYWVVPEIDPALLGEQLGTPVEPRILRLAPDSGHGFRRDWPVVAMTPQRHYGYAAQWFGMAVALVAIFAITGARRARTLSGSTEEQ